MIQIGDSVKLSDSDKEGIVQGWAVKGSRGLGFRKSSRKAAMAGAGFVIVWINRRMEYWPYDKVTRLPAPALIIV